MALVICRQLCSGKSTAAACLAEDTETMDPKPTVGIVDESSLHLGGNQSYAGFWHLYCPWNIAMLALSRLTSLNVPTDELQQRREPEEEEISGDRLHD